MSKINKEEFYRELEKYISNLENKRDDIKILNFVIDNTDEISEEIIQYISNKTGLMETGIRRTIDFYPKFRRRAQKIEELSVCNGKMCTAKGADKIYDYLFSKYSCDEEGLSLDRSKKINRCRCLGRCQNSVNISINGEIKSNITLEKIKKEF